MLRLAIRSPAQEERRPGFVSVAPPDACAACSWGWPGVLGSLVWLWWLFFVAFCAPLRNEHLATQDTAPGAGVTQWNLVLVVQPSAW